ncbi:MAG: hypothetical protein ACOC56_06135 [Atribacterota bacterium]
MKNNKITNVKLRKDFLGGYIHFKINNIGYAYWLDDKVILGEVHGELAGKEKEKIIDKIMDNTKTKNIILKEKI